MVPNSAHAVCCSSRAGCSLKILHHRGIHISLQHASQSYSVILISERQTHVKISFLSHLENAASVPLIDQRQFKEAGHAVYPSPGNASVHTIYGSCVSLSCANIAPKTDATEWRTICMDTNINL